MTPDTEPAVVETETFTLEELDEVNGALLFAGALHQALAGILDITNDPESLEFVEFINHEPTDVAIPLLAAQAMALAEAKVRIDELITATRAALNSTAARVASQVDEAEETKKGNEDG